MCRSRERMTREVQDLEQILHIRQGQLQQAKQQADEVEAAVAKLNREIETSHGMAIEQMGPKIKEQRDACVALNDKLSKTKEQLVESKRKWKDVAL